jgi:hypothetical protein
MFDLRLIRADALKLRRRRGMLALCAVLTFGILTLIFIVTGLQHASDPFQHPPAGGFESYQNNMVLLMLMMLVVGAIVGATAGAQDLESGVFRDLAATGRSRLALFGARTPGAWAIVLPIAALGAAVVAVFSLTMADGVPGPTTAMIISGTAGALASGALSSAVSVGLAALTGSRAAVITAMLAFTLALAPLLSGIKFLGDARQAIPTSALLRIGDAPDQVIHMGLFTAIVVCLGWGAAALAVGAWRTRAREI